MHYSAATRTPVALEVAAIALTPADSAAFRRGLIGSTWANPVRTAVREALADPALLLLPDTTLLRAAARLEGITRTASDPSRLPDMGLAPLTPRLSLSAPGFNHD